MKKHFFLFSIISFKGVLSIHEKKSDDIIQIQYFDPVSLRLPFLNKGTILPIFISSGNIPD